MISEDEKQTIRACASRHGASRVLLFGSALGTDTDYEDIDLAVDGLPNHLFFNFYGDLIRHLEKPVDVVDLQDNDSFARYVASQGVPVYEQH